MNGLTAAQVAAAKPNDVPRQTSRSMSAIIRANVLTFFNLVIGVLWVLILIFGDWKDGLFGLVIVANAAIGIVQEWRAKRTLDKLAVINEAPVRVRRDGADHEIEPRAVVQGDLILLGPGDRLLVDGDVVHSDNLEIDESLLTGEADPVHKKPGDEVLSGSFVVAGSGAFTATKVGADAYAVKLAQEASQFSLAHSDLRDGITKFIKFITWLVVPIGILLIWSQLRNDTSFDVAITRAVAGLVTMIPEGLVLMTSIAFAVGVVRLGRRGALVQELPAIEGLARVDVLCVDKTGTLTQGGMDLDEVIPLAGAPYADPLAALANVDPRPNPTAQAIQARFPTTPDGWQARENVPFSSARKWSGADFGDRGCWVLGAPDVLMEPGTPGYGQARQLAMSGTRVLALCRTPDLSGTSAEPAALVTLKQRLRPDATATMEYFAKQGVAVKVISGDSPDAVSAIARTIGIPGAANAVDARLLDEADYGQALEDNTVFGRVTPQQKRAFVSALQSRGHTVAMTGDGVNDVLALKDADLGIAMGAGSPATKAVAQVVLMDNRFSTLPHVVGEGRRVLANIERVSGLFLTKTFYAIIISLLVGVIGLTFPFAPRHSTLVNALTIGIPAFFLALAPTYERAKPGFVPRVLRFAIPAGLVCGVATMISFMAASPGSSLTESSTAAVITLFLVSWWVLVLIARPLTMWRIGLIAAMAALFVAALAIPFVREFFALEPGDVGNDLIAVTIAAVAAVIVTVAVKLTATLRT
ncbi:HAD-IC family P-type ATPase [Nonomuraea soli]|uniref:Cation-transporting ATPase E n=1 Tax=Nonomuraea soli TaxID=1032476 RepID=A0A7W0CQ51_9ACTN|nr:HAD-IC family P-type ATPase [Nonomuraea soli]MBA2895202.1 cation-transporting ATPase E [Nonomuraea soli]